MKCFTFQINYPFLGLDSGSASADGHALGTLVQVFTPPLASSVIQGESLNCSVPDDAKREMGIIIVPA